MENWTNIQFLRVFKSLTYLKIFLFLIVLTSFSTQSLAASPGLRAKAEAAGKAYRAKRALGLHGSAGQVGAIDRQIGFGPNGVAVKGLESRKQIVKTWKESIIRNLKVSTAVLAQKLGMKLKGIGRKIAGEDKAPAAVSPASARPVKNDTGQVSGVGGAADVKFNSTPAGKTPTVVDGIIMDR